MILMTYPFTHISLMLDRIHSPPLLWQQLIAGIIISLFFQPNLTLQTRFDPKLLHPNIYMNSFQQMGKYDYNFLNKCAQITSFIIQVFLNLKLMLRIKDLVDKHTFKKCQQHDPQALTLFRVPSVHWPSQNSCKLNLLSKLDTVLNMFYHFCHILCQHIHVFQAMRKLIFMS